MISLVPLVLALCSYWQKQSKPQSAQEENTRTQREIQDLYKQTVIFIYLFVILRPTRLCIGAIGMN